jgi:DNA-binding beta-propeller fold protein YncE
LVDPLALALDSKGRLFVAGATEVYVLNKDYLVEAIIGNTSSATIKTPQMGWPGDVALDSAGRLYVCDWKNDVGGVHIFDPKLAYVGLVRLPSVPAAATCMAVDSRNRLIVGQYVSGGESRFLVYAANESDPKHGSMILEKTFQLCPPVQNCTGRHGSPEDITVDSRGMIVVAERPTQEAPYLNRVVVLDEEFGWLVSFGSGGDGPGSFQGITSAAVDPSGVFIPTDWQGISFFFPNGTYAGRIGGSGSEPGQFSGIGRLLVTGPGQILVPEHLNDRIQEITVNISSLRAIPIPDFGALAFIVLCGLACARSHGVSADN